MNYYVQIEELTNNVIGYSSSKINENDIEILPNEVEEIFLNTPIFFKYNNSTKKFEFSEELKNKILKKKQSILSDSQKIESLTKQLATNKLDSMKKDLTINMLIKQQAQNKIEIMNMKGSNTNE